MIQTKIRGVRATTHIGKKVYARVFMLLGYPAPSSELSTEPSYKRSIAQTVELEELNVGGRQVLVIADLVFENNAGGKRVSEKECTSAAPPLGGERITKNII